MGPMGIHNLVNLPSLCGPSGAPPSLPPPASFLSFLCLAIHELYLTSLTTHSLSASLLCSLTHVGLQRPDVRRWWFLEMVHISSKPSSWPGPGVGSLSSVALWSGLSAWHLPARSPLSPAVVMKKGGEQRSLQPVSSLAFVLFLKMELWLNAQISL